MATPNEQSSVSPAAPPKSRWAIRSPLTIALFVLVAAAGLAGDLLSKHYVFNSFLDNPQFIATSRNFSSGR